MTLPGENMDEYMKKETGKTSYDIIWEKKVQGEPQDMATAVFAEYGRKAFSFATGGLCGCTALFVISRRAVYVAHYWENISFSPDKAWVDEYGDADNAFQQTVIKGLNDGVGRGQNPEQVSLKSKVNRIADDHVRAYLMIPTTNADEVEDAYRDKWNLMKETVNGLIPRLREDGRWTEIRYEALDSTDPMLSETAMGKVLFKFDPDHNGMKKAALWIERNPEPWHDDEWQ